jgi:hypothetical protein
VVADQAVARWEADLFSRGWNRARRSGLCARCVTPFLAGALVSCDRTAGFVGPCCARRIS